LNLPAGLGSGNFSFANIAAGLVFSGIGFVAFAYGKREGDYKSMALGGALMTYCYFTPTTLLTCLGGVALTAALYYWRD